METPPWFQELVRAMADEEGPPLMTLATLAGDGSPRARLVVIRHYADDGSIVFCSDGRSEKNAQVRRDPRAEAVCWASNRRTQYRLRGRCDIDEDEAVRNEIWRQLSESARALFAWPTPGADRAPDDAFTAKVSEDDPMPANFEVLRLVPTNVDRLDLSATPHRRTIFDPVDAPGRDVNP